MLKKILISALSVIDAFLLYYGICHIIEGLNAPVLVGNGGNAYFMGLHIMGITFISIFAVISIVIIMIALYMPNKKGKVNEKD